MRLAIVLVIAFAAYASAQAVDGGWGAFSECSTLCGGGISYRGCNSPTPSNGGKLCTDSTNTVSGGGNPIAYCNTQPCVNCTVTGLSWYSPCTKPCGTGITWRARTIIQEPDLLHGGTPCPPLNITYLCNTYFCLETIGGYGYYFWGPFKGPGPLTYNIIAWDETLDIFVFDQPNFFQYQYDAARMPPFQTGYTPVRSMLNVDNAFDIVPLDNGISDYYLVIDNTLIGGATGTANAQGQITFPSDRFQYSIEGIDPGPGYNTAPATSGASSTASPAVAVVVAAALLIAALQ